MNRFVVLRNDKGRMWRISERMWCSILKNARRHGFQEPKTHPPFGWDEKTQGPWKSQYDKPQEQIVDKEAARRLMDALNKNINDALAGSEIKIDRMDQEDAVPYLENLMDFIMSGTFTIGYGKAGGEPEHEGG